MSHVLAFKHCEKFILYITTVGTRTKTMTIFSWPYNIREDGRHRKCLVTYVDTDIEKNPSLIVIDISTGFNSWYISFSKEHGMRVCINHTGGPTNDPKLPLDTHPHLCQGIIRVLALCIAMGEVTFPIPFVEVTPAVYSDLSQTMNAMLCAARARAARHSGMSKRVLYAMRNYRYHHALAKKIQRAWRRAVSDPSYTVCRKRLLGEYVELASDYNARTS